MLQNTIVKGFMEFGQDAMKLKEDELRFAIRHIEKDSKKPIRKKVYRMLQYDVARDIITEIAVPENRWLRLLCPNAEKTIDKFIIVHFGVENQYMPKNILYLANGIRLDQKKFCTVTRYGIKEDDNIKNKWEELIRAKTYRFFLQSASQMRTCEAVFMRQDTAEFEGEWMNAVKALNYGVIPTQKMSINKFLAYTALSQSSSINVGEMQFRIIDDPVVGGRMPFDGGGMISKQAARRIADQLNLPYVPSAFQVRLGGIKGLVVTMDIDTDLIVTKSMVKIKPMTDRLPVEVCLYSKPQAKLNQFTYQFIQALDISFDNLKELADREFDRLEGILTDPDKACAYLSLVGTGMDEDNVEAAYEENLRSKVMQVLDVNKKALYDPWVQIKLRQLMDKRIRQMARGRIPIEGGFYFVTTDPSALLGKPVLKPGEIYFNGKEGEVALFRTPLIHRSEVSKATMVNRPEVNEALGHIKDVIVLNMYDDILLRAGGADIDGDKMFITSEPLILNSVEEGLPCITTEAGTPNVKDVTYFNILAHVAANIKMSLIGTVTDMATTWADLYRTQPSTEIDERIIELRKIQGLLIDSAKTGQVVSIPRYVRISQRPHWLGRPNHEAYHSTSPMGRLYDYVHDRLKQFRLDGISKPNAMLFGILRLVDDPEKFTMVYPMVRQYLSEYKKALAVIHDNHKDNPEEANKLVADTIEFYKAIMDDLMVKYGVVNVTAAAYYAAYSTATKETGYSFPWVTCFDGMLEILSRIAGNQYFLVPLRVAPNKTITENKQLTVTSRLVFDNNEFVGVCAVPDGTYDFTVLDNRVYAMVPRTVPDTTPVNNMEYEVWVVGLTKGQVQLCNDLVSSTAKLLPRMDAEGNQYCVMAVQNGDTYKKIGKVANDSLIAAILLADRDTCITAVKTFNASVLFKVRAL